MQYFNCTFASTCRIQKIAHVALHEIGVLGSCICQNRQTKTHHDGLVPAFRPLSVVYVLARVIFEYNRSQ